MMLIFIFCGFWVAGGGGIIGFALRPVFCLSGIIKYINFRSQKEGPIGGLILCRTVCMVNEVFVDTLFCIDY
jgi:hypothetical protein